MKRKTVKINRLNPSLSAPKSNTLTIVTMETKLPVVYTIKPVEFVDLIKYQSCARIFNGDVSEEFSDNLIVQDNG